MDSVCSAESTIRKSYIDLRGINLGMPFVNDAGLIPGKVYSMIVPGIEDDIEGTLDKSGFIGGLAKLYRVYRLDVGDKLLVEYDGAVIKIKPPDAKCVRNITPDQQEDVLADERVQYVFEQQKLRHIHIEPYAPGNLSSWVPRSEPDVYMVFGALSEYTDYRYCCGINQALIDQLGYKAETKPDAILIDRTTGQYLMTEFKVNSNEFTSNHHKDDVDALVCWNHNETDLSKLPPIVIDLKRLLETAVREGDIDI